MLFAAPLVTRAFAIEPDPLCRAALRQSVALNPPIAGRTFVSSLCISDGMGELTMRGSGSSGSFVAGLTNSSGQEAYAREWPGMAFTVYCVPLPAFLREHEIDASATFFKVDTEGAEWRVLPSLLGAVAALPEGARPTFFMSIHESTSRDVGALLAFLRLFKYAALLVGETERQPPSGAAGELTRELFDAWCPLVCELVASDLMPPP